MLVDFQRNLPSSLTDFGWDAHGGQRQELWDSLPPHIESVRFSTAPWFRDNPRYDLSLKLPPQLAVLKNPYCTKGTQLDRASLTHLRIDAYWELPVPPTVTRFRLQTSYLISTTNAVLRSCPPCLKRLHIEGPTTLDSDLLPPGLTHLTLSRTFQLKEDIFAKLPQSLTFLAIFKIDLRYPFFWTRDLASLLPKLETLRIARTSDSLDDIEVDWQLPPHLTHLECRNDSFSVLNPPNNFFALTHLHFFRTTLDEALLLQMPTTMVSIKVCRIELHGLVTIDDPSLWHLSKPIILEHFQRWIKDQKERHGRVIFSFETRFGKIHALPPNIQTISRKLRLATLDMVLPFNLGKKKESAFFQKA
jgi:hypothetical protein